MQIELKKKKTHMKRVIQVCSGYGSMTLMLKMLDTSEFISREVPVSWLSSGNLELEKKHNGKTSGLSKSITN